MLRRPAPPPPPTPAHQPAAARPPLLCALTGLIAFSLLLISSMVGQTDLQLGVDKPPMQYVVHLDLKGAPPRPAFYAPFFRLLRDLRVSGVLLEYEDMFPYAGRLAHLARPGHYTPADLAALNQLAAAHGFDLIPLVQSFGHLQFALKWPEFAALRENRTADDTICPSDARSLALIDEMVAQVRHLHPHASTIHMGADEAYHVAEDERCKHALRTRWNQSVDALKLNHISSVARLAHAHNFSRVLVWNDMFGSMRADQLAQFELGQLVQPVVWGYAVDVTAPNYFPPGMFEEYAKVFPEIQFASAFKGANGVDQTFSEMGRYLANLASYHKLQRVFSSALSDRVHTVVLTGWQRYWHGSPLCELLPVGVPALVHQVSYLNDWAQQFPAVDSKFVHTLLECEHHPPEPVLFEGHTFWPPPEWAFLHCQFPGHGVFELTEQLRLLRWKLAIKPARPDLLQQLAHIKQMASTVLAEVYDQDTIEEWIAQTLDPMFREQQQHQQVQRPQNDLPAGSQNT